MKKCLYVLLVTLFFACVAIVPTHAYEIPKVEFNGNMLTFDVPPKTDSGRLLVPLRVIFEALGAKVDWNPETQEITASRQDTEFVLKVGDTKGYRNNRLIYLEVPVQNENCYNSALRQLYMENHLYLYSLSIFNVCLISFKTNLKFDVILTTIVYQTLTIPLAYFDNLSYIPLIL